MAEMVGAYLDRALHQTQWSDYENGVEPPLDVIRGAALVSGLEAPYLAALDSEAMAAVVEAAALRAVKEAQRHPHPMPTVPVEMPPEEPVRATPKKRGKGKRRSA